MGKEHREEQQETKEKPPPFNHCIENQEEKCRHQNEWSPEHEAERKYAAAEKEEEENDTPEDGTNFYPPEEEEDGKKERAEKKECRSLDARHAVFKIREGYVRKIRQEPRIHPVSGEVSLEEKITPGRIFDSLRSVTFCQNEVPEAVIERERIFGKRKDAPENNKDQKDASADCRDGLSVKAHTVQYRGENFLCRLFCRSSPRLFLPSPTPRLALRPFFSLLCTAHTAEFLRCCSG